MLCLAIVCYPAGEREVKENSIHQHPHDGKQIRRGNQNKDVFYLIDDEAIASSFPSPARSKAVRTKSYKWPNHQDVHITIFDLASEKRESFGCGNIGISVDTSRRGSFFFCSLIRIGDRRPTRHQPTDLIVTNKRRKELGRR